MFVFILLYYHFPIEDSSESFLHVYFQIQDARATLDKPEIEVVSFEQGSKFWCYFCTEEIPKHLPLDVCVVKYGGLLEHIARFELYTCVY